MSFSSAVCYENIPNLVSLDELSQRRSEGLKTPLKKLNLFLASLSFQGRLTEWGVPSGSIARLLPAMVAKAMGQECLWISDQEKALLYPNSWTGLGFDLNNLHFLHEESPLQSLRTVVSENSFPFLIIDCRQRLKTSDLHFLSRHAREQGTSIFLFRPFYLSNKNGNPFSNQRLNSSYSISRKSFQLSIIKGCPRRSLSLPFTEVLCG